MWRPVPAYASVYSHVCVHVIYAVYVGLIYAIYVNYAIYAMYVIYATYVFYNVCDHTQCHVYIHVCNFVDILQSRPYLISFKEFQRLI